MVSQERKINQNVNTGVKSTNIIDNYPEKDLGHQDLLMCPFSGHNTRNTWFTFKIY